MKTLRSVLAEAPLAWLLVAVPVTVWCITRAPSRPLLVFVLACVAIVPLAGLLGLATEKLAARVGEAIGGFLNATLGNAAELIIALVALRAGMLDVVKASLTGSIIGNLLLVLGAAFLAGGLQASRPDLRHHRRAHPGRHDGAGRHRHPRARRSFATDRRRQVRRPVGHLQLRRVGHPAGGLSARAWCSRYGTHTHLFQGDARCRPADEAHGTPWSTVAGRSASWR